MSQFTLPNDQLSPKQLKAIDGIQRNITKMKTNMQFYDPRLESDRLMTQLHQAFLPSGKSPQHQTIESKQNHMFPTLGKGKAAAKHPTKHSTSRQLANPYELSLKEQVMRRTSFKPFKAVSSQERVRHRSNEIHQALKGQSQLYSSIESDRYHQAFSNLSFLPGQNVLASVQAPTSSILNGAYSVINSIQSDQLAARPNAHSTERQGLSSLNFKEMAIKEPQIHSHRSKTKDASVEEAYSTEQTDKRVNQLLKSRRIRIKKQNFHSQQRQQLGNALPDASSVDYFSTLNASKEIINPQNKTNLPSNFRYQSKHLNIQTKIDFSKELDRRHNRTIKESMRPMGSLDFAGYVQIEDTKRQQALHNLQNAMHTMQSQLSKQENFKEFYWSPDLSFCGFATSKHINKVHIDWSKDAVAWKPKRASDK